MTKKLPLKKYGFTKEELIQEVKNDTEVGKQIVKTHLDYLKFLASGELHEHI